MQLAFGFYVVFVVIAGCDNAFIPVKYLGCLIQNSADEMSADDANRRGPFIFEAKAKVMMNVNECVNLCFEHRYKVAAVQGGTHCFCAENTRGMITRTDDFCYERCPGNCRQRCGGLVTMSVYTTGYQREPDLSISDWLLGRGLIGCHKKEAVFYTCGDGKTKPNLKTLRMTAKMCTLYCASGSPSQFMLIATVVADNECCCGSQKDRAHNNQHMVGHNYCNLPCRGARAPGCVGHGYTKDGKLQYYVTVYDVDNMRKDGIPNEPFKTFRAHRSGWMNPAFPDDDKFELKDGIIQAQEEARLIEEERKEAERLSITKVNATTRPAKKGKPTRKGRRSLAKREAGQLVIPDRRAMPELHGETGDSLTKTGRRGRRKTAPPIIDPENTGVKVVDVPTDEDEEDVSVSTTVLELLACTLLMAGMTVIILKKKKIQEAPPEGNGRAVPPVTEGTQASNAADGSQQAQAVVQGQGPQPAPEDASQPTSGEDTTTCTETDTSQAASVTDDDSLSPLLPAA